jgi:hypothetical protein
MIIFCIIFPIGLAIFKIVAFSLSDSTNSNVMTALGCIRMFVLYQSFLYNFLRKRQLSIGLCEGVAKESLQPLPVQIIAPVINYPNITISSKLSPSAKTPQRHSLQEGLASKLPFLLAEKVKIPKFITSQGNTDTEGNQSPNSKNLNNESSDTLKEISFIEEISILYRNDNHNINDKYASMIGELNRIADINFNVFNLSKQSNNMEILVLLHHLLRLYNFDEALKINTKNYNNYFFLINTTYRKNPYHNSIHGCDVTQTLYFIMKTCNIDVICNLSDLEIFSAFFACAIHDLDHPGNNNNYEIAVQSKLTLTYNDKQVLENYHLCKAFSMLKKHDCDIFESFSLQNYNKSRGIIINMVLSTDMANHFTDIALLNKRCRADDFNPQGNDKQLLLNHLIHSSDISNPMKPMDIYKEWVNRVFLEFYHQGDKEREKGMKISFLCDRNTVNIPEAQVSFIEGFVLPLYEALSVPFPNMQMVTNLIKNNKEEFGKLKNFKPVSI